MSSKYNMDCYLNPVPIRRLETVDRKLQRLRKLHVHFEDLQTAYTKTYKYGNSRGIIESQLKDAPHTSSSSKLLEVPTIINFFRDTKEVNIILLFVALLSDLCWWRFLMTMNEIMVCVSTSSVAHYCFSDIECSLLTSESFLKDKNWLCGGRTARYRKDQVLGREPDNLVWQLQRVQQRV